MKTAFPENGRFFKGNLHAHTTISDGRMAPEELCRVYQDRGYDFIALTDHRIYGTHDTLQRPDFLIMPGVELDMSFPPQCHHIVAIGGPDNRYAHGHRFTTPAYEGLSTAQRMIEEISAAGQLTLYCHPRWSRVTLADFASLEGVWGVEIMNHGCEVEDRTGDAEVYLEHLWWMGKPWYAVSTDDTHQRIDDMCGAFVMVKAEELTVPAVFSALREGHFYASTGPEIHGIRIDDRQVRVTCSPCARIHFVTYPRHGKTVTPDRSALTEASFEIPAGTQYVRVQCVDQSGASAWSQPFFCPR